MMTGRHSQEAGADPGYRLLMGVDAQADARHGSALSWSGVPAVVLVPDHARQQRLDARQGGLNSGLGDLDMRQRRFDVLIDLDELPVENALVLVDGVLMRRDLHQMPDDLVILLRVHRSSSYAIGAALRVR